MLGVLLKILGNLFYYLYIDVLFTNALYSDVLTFVNKRKRSENRLLDDIKS